MLFFEQPFPFVLQLLHLAWQIGRRLLNQLADPTEEIPDPAHGVFSSAGGDAGGVPFPALRAVR